MLPRGNEMKIKNSIPPTLITLIISIIFSTSSWASDIPYFVIAKQARPFQIETNNQQHQGIITEIVEAVFEDNNYSISYNTFPYNRMMTQLASDNYPNWITYDSPNWGGLQGENLSSIPVYKVQHALLSSKKVPFTFKNIDMMKGKIAVLLDGFQYPGLQPYIDSGHLNELRVKDYRAAFKVVEKLAGESFFVEMDTRIKYNLEQQNKDLKRYSIQYFGTIIPDYQIHLAYDPKMTPELQSYIDSRLMEMSQNGKLNKIVQKYQ